MNPIAVAVENRWLSEGYELFSLNQLFRYPFKAAKKDEVYFSGGILHSGHKAALAFYGPGPGKAGKLFLYDHSPYLDVG